MTKPTRDGSCSRFALGEIPAEGEASRRTIESAIALYAEYPEFCSGNAGTIPQGVSGLMFFGYPLKHSTQDRTPPLKNLHPSIRALFVSGDKDPFCCGLEGAIRKCKADVKLERIRDGRHDVWSPYDATRHASIHRAIRSFMGACLASS